MCIRDSFYREFITLHQNFAKLIDGDAEFSFVYNLSIKLYSSPSDFQIKLSKYQTTSGQDPYAVIRQASFESNRYNYYGAGYILGGLLYNVTSTTALPTSS
eukprot:TRINITY_DN10224_c0_g1_i1.p1 TRINITY_DN10224_c0_g1~~TRINITY_DN10224_c0_g1_i1.p1  ORF type:complete len:101 (+),score=27.67 TRINITY_DN10224_c0_g1_i1:65-367(+)